MRTVFPAASLEPSVTVDPGGFDVTVFGVDPDPDLIRRFQEAGTDRAIVSLPAPVGERAAGDLQILAGKVL